MTPGHDAPQPWVLAYNTARRLRSGAMPALPGDVVALVMLLDAKGSQLVIDIAEHFAMSASTASELVTRAEGHGLVVKARNPANARTVIVDLSPAAQQRLTR